MPIQDAVAATILAQLEAFPGYPAAGPGLQYFVTNLADLSVSVEHARHIVKTFDERFPTLRELRDTAAGCKPQFVHETPIHEKWAAEYGPPDHTFYEKMQAELASLPVGVRADDKMWAAIKQKLKVKTFRDVPIGLCWRTAQELGFPLNRYQMAELERYNLIHPPAKSA